MFKELTGKFNRFQDLGVHAGLPDDLAKRVRLTNLVAILCMSVAIVSLPFDAIVAPRWMILEDIIAILIFGTVLFMDFKGEFVTFPKGKFCDILDGLAYMPQMLKLPQSWMDQQKWKQSNAAGARRVNLPYSVEIQ